MLVDVEPHAVATSSSVTPTTEAARARSRSGLQATTDNRLVIWKHIVVTVVDMNESEKLQRISWRHNQKISYHKRRHTGQGLGTIKRLTHGHVPCIICSISYR